jgi:hypothetical protein
MPQIIIIFKMLTNFLKRTIHTGRIGTQLAFRFSTEGEKPSAVEITKENAQLIISKWVKDNKVVLFMKGTPHQPLCGYSNFVVELLKKYGIFLII